MKYKNLNETSKMMGSENYKERFMAEYYQLENRSEKLDKVLNDSENGKLTFKLSCPYELLKKQSEIMKEYLNILKERAKIENIEL